MNVLGLNAAFHDSAACLVRDGEVVAAVEEERLTRIKHAKRPTPFTTYALPFAAIDCCLAQAGLRLADVDHVVYSFDPWLLLDRGRAEPTITLPLEPSAQPKTSGQESVWEGLFLASIVNAPRHLRGGVPHHLQRRLSLPPGEAPFEWHFMPHHLAHAASAYLPSPFDRAAILTLDGRGERGTTFLGHGEAGTIEALQQVNLPHSLGLLYERVTEYLGFLHSSDEYKVMALASYGRPRYADTFRTAVRAAADGTYTVAPMDLEALFGPRRLRGEALQPRHYDVARSLQMVLEETVLALCDWLHGAAGSDNLCLAGGVALNCVLNARIRDASRFKHVWVQPAAGDAGTALGAALWLDVRLRGQRGGWRMEHAFLGPEYPEREIEAFLRWSKVPYRRLDNLAEATAELLAEDLIVGWFQGRMEFGPRALGARSILASPRSPAMQARLNEIKDREDFRPVAPVVLEEEAARWFRDAGPSPFMLFVHEVLAEAADRIPAVRHVDGTARIQTIGRDQHPLYYDLLRAFQRRTGIPVLVNTSFNTRGEPIVCSPRDAVECFWTSPLDALVIGPFLLQKRGGAP